MFLRKTKGGLIQFFVCDWRRQNAPPSYSIPDAPLDLQQGIFF